MRQARFRGRRMLHCLLLPAVGVVLALPAGVAGASRTGPEDPCSNPNCSITIVDGTPTTADQAATPYPAVINPPITDPTAWIDKVTVTVNGFTHASPEDVDILLVRQVGQSTEAVELLSDAGGRLLPAAGVNLTFDDAASSSIPQSGPITGGTYKPSNYAGSGLPCLPDGAGSPTGDAFPAPAPSAPAIGYSQELRTFHGDPSSGQWRLYVGDDCSGGSGSISSWSVNVTFRPCVDLCFAKHQDAATVLAGSPIGFDLEGDNADAFNTLFGVGLSDPLPSGPGFDWSIDPPYQGPGTCSINGSVGSQVLSCAFGDWDPFVEDGVHVSSPTSSSGCGTYTNTATLSAANASSQQDTASVRLVGCPTAVTLASYTGVRDRGSVRLRWRMGSDAGLLGFNVWRGGSERSVRLNRRLVPSGSRSFVDRRAPARPVRYWVETIRTDGDRRFYGPIAVR